jgi:hypothetical protein
MRYALPALLSLMVATIGGCESAQTDDTADVQGAADASAETVQLAGPCEPCTNDRECADGLACDHRVGIWVCKTPVRMDSDKPVCDADCVPQCKTKGRCHAIDGECRAISNEECAASKNCADSGECKLNVANGYCNG